MVVLVCMCLPGIFIHSYNLLNAITLYSVDAVCERLVIDSGSQIPQAQVSLSHTEPHTETQVRTYTYTYSIDVNK